MRRRARVNLRRNKADEVVDQVRSSRCKYGFWSKERGGSGLEGRDGVSGRGKGKNHQDPAIGPAEADEGGSNEQETDEMGEDLVGYVLERG